MCSSIDGLAAVQAAGYDYAEINTFALLPEQDDAAFASVRAQALAAPIPIEACNCFVPGRLKVTGPDVDLAAVRQHMDIVLRRAAELGVAVMVFGSGGARRAPEGFAIAQARAQYLEIVRLAGDLADGYGITIALEPLGAAECNIFNRVDQGAQFVTTLAHPRVKLLADSYHMLTVDEPFANVTAAGPLLAHIHVDMPDVAAIAAGASSSYPAFLVALRSSGYSAERVTVENHSFTPTGGRERAAYYAPVRDYLAALLGG
jgi:sugar phosphate isomerase/epimerase